MYLEDVISTIIDHRGRTPKKLGGDWAPTGQGIMALSAKLVKNNTLNNLDNANWVTPEMYSKWMPEELEDGDILMTSEAPLGEFYFIKGYSKYCLSQRLFAIRSDKTICTPSYLFMYLSLGEGYQQIIGKQSGSTVFGIRQDELRKVYVVVPPISIQNSFSSIADPLFLKIRNNELETIQLTKLRNWLLPLLMNGQATIAD